MSEICFSKTNIGRKKCVFKKYSWLILSAAAKFYYFPFTLSTGVVQTDFFWLCDFLFVGH